MLFLEGHDGRGGGVEDGAVLRRVAKDTGEVMRHTAPLGFALGLETTIRDRDADADDDKEHASSVDGGHVKFEDVEAALLVVLLLGAGVEVDTLAAIVAHVREGGLDCCSELDVTSSPDETSGSTGSSARNVLTVTSGSANFTDLFILQGRRKELLRTIVFPSSVYTVALFVFLLIAVMTPLTSQRFEAGFLTRTGAPTCRSEIIFEEES